jgi:hypothetical protein
MPGQPALELGQEGPRDGTPQPLVADFGEALRPHVRQKAPDDLLGRQGHGLPALILGLLIAEAHVAVLDRETAALGQRHPVEISPQVLQDWLGAWHGGFAVDDPSAGPERCRNGQVGPFPMYAWPKPAAKELGQGLDGYQVGGPGWPPLRVISGAPPGRDQAVPVRLVGQGAAPGVQHTEAPDPPTDRMRVRRARDARWGRGAAQDGVPVVWVAADELPQRLREGQDEVKIGDREEFPAPVFQPGCGVEAMTRGAAAVAAGVIDRVCLTAGLAWPQRPAPDLGPAREESRDGPAMAGQQLRRQPVQVLAAIPPQDVRHLQHARAPEGLEIGHEGGDGGVHHVQGRGRQMGGAGGSPWALVAEQGLNDPQRHASLSEMGGIGVPQRLDGGILGNATPAYHPLEGLLEGSRRERRLLGPGEEPPGVGPLALPVRPQHLSDPRGPGDEALVAALALAHAPQQALRVAVRDLQRGPFPQAQPTGREQLQTHPGARVHDQGQQGADLPPTQHDRPFVGGAGGARGRSRAPGVSAGVRQRIAAHRGESGRCSRRPAAH